MKYVRTPMPPDMPIAIPLLPFTAVTASASVPNKVERSSVLMVTDNGPVILRSIFTMLAPITTDTNITTDRKTDSSSIAINFSEITRRRLIGWDSKTSKVPRSSSVAIVPLQRFIENIIRIRGIAIANNWLLR